MSVVFSDKTVGLRESLVCVAFGQEHRVVYHEQR
jgi:hypothetical protein